ncbi:MAG: secondary thiamine-phosphate synthase enzyme YjbQ [Desulfobacteraceae bacterium]|nr:secondary thiamine-phosphate synthase enzyme YjbQ [Desulfobacteraceae bacterium]
MTELKIHTDTLYISLATGCDIKNITSQINQIAIESAIKNGMVNIFVVGSTGSVTTIEYEPGVVEDLKRAIDEIAPQGLEYEHEKAWHDGNGHSHVQAALIGPSLTIPVRSSKLKLGTWQQVVVINHDNHPRKREIEVTITGT